MINIRKIIKKIIFSNLWFYSAVKWIKSIYRSFFCGNFRLENKGVALVNKDIQGKNHSILIEEECILCNTKIYIRGNNNKIIFEKGCHIGENCSFWMEGNNISIIIGEGTTFTHTVHFCAQEDGTTITVGKDCMFSNNIIVRTSDSHPMYDIENGNRINMPHDVLIGEHVWIAPNTKIMKGAIIGNGAVIGSDTMVTKEIPTNSLAVGHPAKVVRQNIEWTREKLF